MMIALVSSTSLALTLPKAIDRRGALSLGSASALLGACKLGPLPAFAAAPDYAGAKRELASMIAADPDLGPTLLRLAWHSSGT